MKETNEKKELLNIVEKLIDYSNELIPQPYRFNESEDITDKEILIDRKSTRFLKALYDRKIKILEKIRKSINSEKPDFKPIQWKVNKKKIRELLKEESCRLNVLVRLHLEEIVEDYNKIYYFSEPIEKWISEIKIIDNFWNFIKRSPLETFTLKSLRKEFYEFLSLQQNNAKDNENSIIFFEKIANLLFILTDKLNSSELNLINEFTSKNKMENFCSIRAGEAIIVNI